MLGGLLTRSGRGWDLPTGSRQHCSLGKLRYLSFRRAALSGFTSALLDEGLGVSLTTVHEFRSDITALIAL